MSVKRLHMEKFSVFRDVKLEFAEGLNVFIGANATGKSHAMKLMYSILKTHEGAQKDEISDLKRIAARLKEKLAGVFKPDKSGPGRLVQRQVERGWSNVALKTSVGSLGFKLATWDTLTLQKDTLDAYGPSLFIPSREALAMYQGFVDAYDGRELSFDETYYDLCKSLSGLPTRGPRLKQAAQLVGPLEDILGGKVSINDGRFQVDSSDGIVEAQLLAEGFRKIASLVQLINNGSLMKNGALFWDEPEANLNPKLVTKIAEVLRTLADGGVQVFVATHDYLLSHELSLAVEYKTDPQVSTRFFAFNREPDGAVDVESGATLADLEHNSILDEFAAHYDRESKLFAQGRRHGEPEA